jgi:hypothetical protein
VIAGNGMPTPGEAMFRRESTLSSNKNRDQPLRLAGTSSMRLDRKFAGCSKRQCAICVLNVGF